GEGARRPQQDRGSPPPRFGQPSDQDASGDPSQAEQRGDHAGEPDRVLPVELEEVRLPRIPRPGEEPPHQEGLHDQQADRGPAPPYARVPTASVASESKNDVRRPSVSATTPVGISNSAMAAVNAALATKTSKMLRPAWRRNSVLIPQIRDADSVNNPLITR